MLKAKAAFSGFSVDDLAKAKKFYTEILGLTIADELMGMRLQLAMPFSASAIILAIDFLA